MGLQLDWRSIELLVERLADVTRLSLQFEVILNEHPIEEDGDKSMSLHRAVVVESRSGPDNVIGLPFAGLPVGVHQWNALLVNAASLTIHVSLVVVGVENLQLVAGVPSTVEARNTPLLPRVCPLPVMLSGIFHSM